MVGLISIVAMALPVLPGVYIYQRLALAGAFTSIYKSVADFAEPHDYFTVPVAQVEDLYYHTPSKQIITVGQSDTASRFSWFPPWANFDRPEDGKKSRAKIWAIDVETWEPREIAIEGFDGPFVSHGIDVYTSPDDPANLTLHAVNHPPLMIDGQPQPESDSRIEVFSLDLESSTATHVRTLKHPLVKMPNDIFSLGPTELLVTNDHVNTRGLLRFIEDAFTFRITSWTNIVHLTDSSAEIVASGLHNANGLGHGPNNEVALGDASGGQVTTFAWDGTALTQRKRVSAQHLIDNPSWYADPYAHFGSDVSGYVLAGLLDGISLDKTSRDPNAKIPIIVSIQRYESDGTVKRKVLLEDDGNWVSSAATAVLVPLEPEKDGSKYANLVVSGPWSRAIGVMKVDLTDWAATRV